jgi:gluconate 5-dehydrogenase
MSKHPAHSDTFSLEGKVVLITGAARGLGLGYANAAAAAGAHVVLNDRDTGGLAASVEKMRVAGYSCSAAPFDVTSHAEVTKAVATVLAEHKQIDVLVNNAGNQLRKPFVEFTLEEWNSIMDVHVTGSFLVTQTVARHMIERRGGSIVMIGSIVVQSVRGTIAPYTTAKGAVTALAKALAVELGPIGIRCNVIAPGMYETEFNRALMDKPEIYNALAQKIPLKRWGKAADIAPLLVYLASDAGRYVNGQVFTVDGGILAAL